MKTLTIRLPDDLVRDIETESRLRSVTKSDVVRERLQEGAKKESPSGSMDETLGDILKECWSAKVPSHAPQYASKKKQRLAELIRGKKLYRR
jgi:Arc/MetJ-type ribon-helix-helix transcriptional regulator